MPKYWKDIAFVTWINVSFSEKILATKHFWHSWVYLVCICCCIRQYLMFWYETYIQSVSAPRKFRNILCSLNFVQICKDIELVFNMSLYHEDISSAPHNIIDDKKNYHYFLFFNNFTLSKLKKPLKWEWKQIGKA